VISEQPLSAGSLQRRVIESDEYVDESVLYLRSVGFLGVVFVSTRMLSPLIGV
jgi:hypothetical protein